MSRQESQRRPRAFRYEWLRAAVAALLITPAVATAQDDPAPGLVDVIAGTAVVLRLEGDFGSEVTALGLRRVLEHARRLGVGHAVLWIDSPGGLPESGRAVANQMAEFDADFELHVVVDRALGAAVWTVAAADRLWVLPGGHAGAAVSFDVPHADPGTQAQRASVLAAELAAAADRKGLPGDVFRAMVEPQVELWTWIDDAGQRHYAPHEPTAAGTRDVWNVDTDQTVVALSTPDLRRLGLAREASRGDLQHLLASQPFEVDRMLEAASRTVVGLISRRDNARERSLGPIGRIDGLWTRATAARQAAEAAEPDPFIIRTDVRTGEMTAESRRSWQRATDQCVSHWKAYQSILESIGDAERDHVRLTRSANTQAERYHADLLWDAPQPLTPSDIADEARLDVLWREAEAEIRRLRGARGRTR